MSDGIKEMLDRRAAVNDGFNQLDKRLEVLHNDVTDMKDVLKSLTSAVTRLALIEERQAQAAAAQERSFRAIEGVEKRVADIEKRMPEQDRTAKYVEMLLTALAVAALLYAAKKVGLV